VDSAVPFRSRGLPISTAHTRTPPSPPSYASYGWGRAPHTAMVVGSRIDAGVGRPTLQYAENRQDQYSAPYGVHRNYEPFPGRIRYEGRGYGMEAPLPWKEAHNEEYFQQWPSCGLQNDMQNEMQYRSGAPHGRSANLRRQKPVPLNRNGVPDSEVDSSVCKTLHQDLMKFSAKLNPIYGWKTQPEELQLRLRDRLADAYGFEGPVSLSESWLSSEISDGIGRNKFRLRTLIRGGQEKPPEVSQSHWDSLIDLENEPETQEQSARMRSITHGKPPKGFSAKSIEKSVIAVLVS
jgi:hypothetical protein